MNIFSRKSTALDNLHAAQKALDDAKQREPSERLESVGRCGIHPSNGYHPDHDRGALLVAEAQLRVAEARHAFCADEPEAAQLCAALDAALASTRDRLAAVVDEPEPTLSSTPEAKAEYDARCAEHASACRANSSSRLSIIASAAKRLVKGAQPSPRMLDELARTVEDARSELAAVVDPEEPVLGAVSPVTVEALGRALAAHRVHVDAAAKQRESIRQDLIPVLRAILRGYEELSRKRRAQNLPSPELFAKRVGGESASLGRLAALAMGEGLTPERCDVWRGAIGCPPADVEGAKFVLRSITSRRSEYERQEAAKAAEAARQERKNFG